MTTAPRLEHLRTLMKEHNVHAYIVPTADPHQVQRFRCVLNDAQSEYVMESAKRREFISGFTGSAGTAVITQFTAHLWTDGRYFLQAEQELESCWTLMKMGRPGSLKIADFLAKTLQPSSRVGVDAYMCSVDWARSLLRSWTASGATLELKTIPENLIDVVWNAAGRPAPGLKQVIVHPIEYAGQSVSDKIRDIRGIMCNFNADALLITALDDIAWLLNCRGSDINYNPVFLSYCIITLNECTLYVNIGQVDEPLKQHLTAAGVAVAPYDSVTDGLRVIKGRVIIDTSQCNLALRQIVDDSNVLEISHSIVAAKKCVKNMMEREGMGRAYIFDGVAMVRLLAWLEMALKQGENITEARVDEELTEIRKLNAEYVGESFKTISAVGPNASVIHYSYPDGDTSAQVDPNGLFLLDTGAQYKCGTTDTTRTLHFGTPSPTQTRAYTRVLQGHIALATAVFPQGTVGEQLDSFARRPLWNDGLDYDHGTGHGVGAFLSVHEYGPGIFASSKRRSTTQSTPLQAGMCVSNEPGYYLAGEWGIRIESVLMVMQRDNGFLCFENLTVAPLDCKMIDVTLLTKDEIEWINAYHTHCLHTLEPHLDDESTIHYLKTHTKPL